jgi:tetratricopeptide (TPR) repeat protein
MRNAETMNITPPASRQADLELALQHHASGRLDEAEPIYQRLYASDRRDSEVIYLMGVLCYDLGLFEAACKFLEEALSIAPRFPEASGLLAGALNGLADQKAAAGQLHDAERLLEKALRLLPHDAQTLQGVGRLALLRGEFAAAESRLESSLTERADDAETINLLGLARLRLGKYAAAETSLRRALKLQPGLNQARNTLGLVLHHLERLDEAEDCFEQALVRDPAYQNARINLANTLRIRGKPAQARRELDTVLAAQPNAGDAHNNLGAVLQDLGESELALASLSRALELSPDSPQVRWNLALTQLQRGDFEAGWSNFESRWSGCAHLRGAYRLPSDRAWRGESLHGKRLVLWAEQGFGDTLQFIRFAQDAALRGAAVSVQAPPELAELLGGAPGVSAVTVTGGALIPEYDFHCPLMSLPYRLGLSTTAAGLHGATPYLFAPTRRVEYWRPRVASHPGLKVGLVWSGSSRRQSAELAAIDARRSIPLERLAPLLSVDGCSFFSLQKDVGSVNLNRRAGTAGAHADAPQLHDFSAEWNNFSDTAAFIANLDLVISVDTAVVHLAGALGKPTWLLNRYDTCWRWLLERDDTPWYSTMRQFRQLEPGAWDPVMAKVARALAEAAMLHRQEAHL